MRSSGGSCAGSCSPPAPGSPATAALGVDWIAEFGLGAELVDREVARGIGPEGVSLRISAITGDDLFGWSVGGGLEF